MFFDFIIYISKNLKAAIYIILLSVIFTEILILMKIILNNEISPLLMMLGLLFCSSPIWIAFGECTHLMEKGSE